MEQTKKIGQTKKTQPTQQGADGKKHISPKKKAELAALSEILAKNNTIIITSIDEMPAFLLQRIRKDLNGKAAIKIVKRRVLSKLFEAEAKKDERFAKVADFCRESKDSCAIIFSNENLFSLLRVLQEKNAMKKAKPGIARDKIVVKAGNTGLMAGPILTALSDAKIKAGLEKGHVVIKEDFELEQGQKITEALADALEKLNIFPTLARLMPLVAYDKQEDILFRSDQLEVNVEQQLKKIKQAYANAFNIIMETKYFTRESAPMFLREAYKGASFLAKEAKIINKDSVKGLLIEAHHQASLINKKL